MDVAEAVSGKLEKELRELLDDRLAAAGAYDTAIHPDSDHNGDPIVRVEVKHRLVEEPIDGKEVIEADRAARDLAWNEGERRFVYVRHIFDEKQTVAPHKVIDGLLALAVRLATASANKPCQVDLRRAVSR